MGKLLSRGICSVALATISIIHENKNLSRGFLIFFKKIFLAVLGEKSYAVFDEFRGVCVFPQITKWAIIMRKRLYGEVEKRQIYYLLDNIGDLGHFL
ncbi:MAG: hypothetical protein IKV97_03345 [Clostridia bacterium]|nr:hypothetical protein [Clostridia bacterium]